MSSQLQILGCSGGIGGDLRTTSLLLDDDILIDAGTGVCDLSLDAMAKIDWVFLTHSHLDHILSLPLLLDSVGAKRSKPVHVYGLPETVSTLKQHIFNGKIWPDFSVIPTAEKPFMIMSTLNTGDVIQVGARSIKDLPAEHSVAGVGYAISAGESTIAFTGDSGPCPDFWAEVQKIEKLKHLLIETSFTDNDQFLAEVSQHYCPATLAQAMVPVQPDTQIWISHLKPGQGDQIMAELNALDRLGRVKPQALVKGQVFHL